MIALFKIWFSIAFLMARPSDLPGDRTTLKISVIAAFVTHVLAISLVADGRLLIAPALLDIIMTAVCLYAALNWCGKPARFNQAFSAYCGVSVVLNLASMLMLRPLDDSTGSDQADVVQMTAHFIYLVWGISAFAHILRFTFDVSIALSIGFSTGFLLLNIMLVNTLFPF